MGRGKEAEIRAATWPELLAQSQYRKAVVPMSVRRGSNP